MATFKHISSKNANYGDAEKYLTFAHDEFTMKPTLDANGRLVPREDYRISTLNCGEEDFAVACMRSNLRYDKNQKREDVKSHHYIISFDPRDGPDNGLTVDKAQELGEKFCREQFPGHQAIVCTHPDGHNQSGNIHVHMAACLTVMLFTALSVFPDYFHQHGTTPPDNPNGVIVDNPIDTADDDTTPAISEIHVSMDNISFNEVGALRDAARIWRNPELYDRIQWDKNAVIEYYGKDLSPAYIPDGLTAANGNGTARVIVDKSGNIVEDTVGLNFYHDYYEDGSPKLTEGVTARKGFSITASKIGILSDCVYLLPENEVKTSDIDGTAVTFGYRSMPYGPYNPDTHEPSGYYDMYVAEFEYDGIEYQIVAEQMEAEEVVKVVSSIIYGEEVIVDK